MIIFLTLCKLHTHTHTHFLKQLLFPYVTNEKISTERRGGGTKGRMEGGGSKGGREKTGGKELPRGPAYGEIDK